MIQFCTLENLQDRKLPFDFVVVFSLLTLSMFPTFFLCFYCYFEQVNVSWVKTVN